MFAPFSLDAAAIRRTFYLIAAAEAGGISQFGYNPSDA